MKATALILCVCAFFLCGPAVADVVIKTVPDWNQPDFYAPGTAGLNVGDYPNWCSPTAASALMGYWEDQLACAGLTDRQVGLGASAPYPNPVNPMTYQQGLWHDGVVELGWFMDTGGWKTAGGPFPPRGIGNTILANISPGAQTYARTAWLDPGGLQKVAFPNAVAIRDNNLATMFATYKAEIDAGRPVLVSWTGWVNLAMGFNTVSVDGVDVQVYNQLQNVSEGHTTCGVGYRDNPAVQGDELIIVQDNWFQTGQYVGVSPGSGFWSQNDYVTIPEPATLVLLALGGLAILRRRHR
ncbi:MAG: PEP-CTERM sorting domain-containing protein [Phycisphaerae bacterium]